MPLQAPAHDWGTRFLLAHDHRRASLAVNLSNRLKGKAVLHLPRLRHSLHRVPSLKHSQRRRVAKEEGKVRKTNLPSSLPRSPLRTGEVSFDNDDAEEEKHDAEYDWDENEEYAAEEEQEDTFAERAFEVGNDHVRHEELDFVCPAQQPEQLRDSLTKTVPKARIIPNKVVMQTTRDPYERWKQATSKELNAFLKTAWKEPTAETKARYFAKKQKVVMHC